MKLEVNSFSLTNIKRDLFKKTRHIDNKPFKKEDLEEYDYDTLFYNIFFTRKNDYLVIIGPKLLNFKKILYPFEIFLNEKKLNNLILIELNPMIFILKFKVNKNILEENQVKIILKNKLSKEFKIKKNNLKVGRNILITKQKNNKLIWIEDWINHYLKMGVNTIVIYDNQSDNQEELIKKYQDDENIYIIPYNFKFGMINCHYHKYLQVALMNDFLYQFCDNNFILNFDIDELLNLKNLSLAQLLHPKINLFFPQKVVPMTDNLPENYSFSDFKDCEIKKLYQANKYIVDSNNTFILSIHDNYSNNKKTISKTNFFYHYHGITTNWKTYMNRFEIKRINKNLIENIDI